MPKNLQLMIISAIVPITRAHDIEKVLKASGATDVLWRPLIDDLPEQVTAAKGGTKGKSEAMQDWLEKNMPKGIAFKPVELLDHWEKAGFRREGLYGALITAIEKKLVKKLNGGKYRRA